MSFWKRNRLLFNCLALLAYTAGAILFFTKYQEDHRKIDMVATVVMGLSMIIKLTDIIEQRREQRKTNAS